jgi:hypothetical protein
MMHRLAPMMLLVLCLAQTACAPRATPQAETFADPIAGLETQFAAVQADSQSEAPTRTAPQRIASLRSLIAQTRAVLNIYSDPEQAARAKSLLAEIEAAEAALFQATYAPNMAPAIRPPATP